MQQNAENISLDVGFIRLFGDNTLQVLSARLKLNFCVSNKKQANQSGLSCNCRYKKTPLFSGVLMECGNDLSSRQVTLQVLSAR